jgi:hypothetical protein
VSGSPDLAADRAEQPAAKGSGLLGWQLLGVALFLFIPLVLFLFVRHPEPVALSLAVGAGLMVGHRVLARPYMAAVRARKCFWCNGQPRPHGEPLPLLTGGGELAAVVCPRHLDPAARFVSFLERSRGPLRLGIFVPLLLLLVALVAAACGERRWLDQAVAIFQLAVGVTVQFAALGYLWARPRLPARLPFPAHNFFLLGSRNLLWVFRLVGLWWIARGALVLCGR